MLMLLPCCGPLTGLPFSRRTPGLHVIPSLVQVLHVLGLSRTLDDRVLLPSEKHLKIAPLHVDLIETLSTRISHLESS